MVLGEGTCNADTDAAIISSLILRKLIWAGLCRRQGEKEVSWRFGSGGKHCLTLELREGKVDGLLRCGGVRLGRNQGRFK